MPRDVVGKDSGRGRCRRGRGVEAVSVPLRHVNASSQIVKLAASSCSMPRGTPVVAARGRSVSIGWSADRRQVSGLRPA